MSRPALQRRSELTRRDLLAAARQLFAQRGYAAVSMEEIAALADVSRGPLYHYFDDKRDLFRAVYDEIDHELRDRVFADATSAGSDATDAWHHVRASAQAYLDACLDPAVQRIVFLDAPAVLGRGASQDLARSGLGLLRHGLQRAIDEGALELQPVEPLAHILRAALAEGAIYIARSADQQEAREQVGRTIDRLLTGLRNRD